MRTCVCDNNSLNEEIILFYCQTKGMYCTSSDMRLSFLREVSERMELEDKIDSDLVLEGTSFS